ncbi:MAG: cysteine desulfurase [Candidatus Cloacimonetes bacterium]|nr:cysteine desulfurase [Candidatus Cloacimonadota bacterium]
MDPIYLDYNASTPLDREVINTMQPYLEGYFGNPSSSHRYGTQTRAAVEKARQQLADLLGCHPDEIIFTSGGTESNNFALKGIAAVRKTEGNHIITSSIEHPAVGEVCRWLAGQGFDISYIPVDEYGLIDLQEMEAAITPKTIFISVMHANNEVGTIQPLSEISRIARKRGIIFHSDAAQSVGKIPVRVEELGVDLLSIAGHKFYAPKGIGALYIRKGIRLEKIMHGADHERNLRAGTENVLEIVGLGKAAELARRDLDKNYQHLREMRDLLHLILSENLEGLKLNGHPELRLPNTLNLSFRDIDAAAIIAELDDLAVSAGAACHADTVTVSSVLAAMKIPLPYARGAIRFSTGRMTTRDEIEQAAGQIISVIRKIREKGTIRKPAIPLCM